MEYLDLEAVNLSGVVEELYNPDNIGAVVLPNFVTGSGIEIISEVFEEYKDLFYPSAPFYGSRKVIHRINWFNLEDEEVDVEALPLELKRVLGHLAVEYTRFFQEIGSVANFEDGCLNALSMYNFHPHEPVGMGRHMEWHTTRNLITILPIEGEASYIVAAEFEEKGSELEYEKGDAILLRAPRSDEEKKQVPFHSVENIGDNHYSMTIRQKTDFPPYVLDPVIDCV